ncbi:MAG: BamA/OMP85 family outer membrane protein [Planctomycetota bacterium]
MSLEIVGCLLIALLLLPAADAHAQEYPVGSVKVTGNVSMETEKILSRVRSKVGDLFNEETANEDVGRIAALVGVASATYEWSLVDGRIQITFVIVEKDIVRSIEFIGNVRVSAKALRRRLGFLIRDYFDLMSAESGRAALEDYYLKKGFAFVVVVLESERLRQGRVVYRIEEGPRVKIHSVKFSGNKAIKTGKLKGVIKTDNKKWFLWLKNYNQKAVQKDLTKLQKVYYRKGFLNSSIGVEREFNEAKSRVRLTFVIAEGPAFTVNRINVTGATRLSEEQIRSRLRLEPGQVYNDKRANLDVKRVLSAYREAGFVDATVQQRRRFVSEDSVDVELQISEGERFRIGAIEITGNTQTQDKVIRRILDEYAFQPGRWYDADAAPETGRGDLERDIRYRALAESVAIRPRGEPYNCVPAKEVCTTDVEVKVEEGKTGEWNWGAGISTDAGFIGQIIYEQRNFDISDPPKDFGELVSVFWPTEPGQPPRAFLGAGQNMRIALEPGTELSQYMVSFREPYFRDRPIELGIMGLSWERERESFEEGRLKAQFGFDQRYQKRYRERWLKSIGFRAENVHVGSFDLDAPREIRNEKGDNLLAGIKFGIGKDLTDDPFTPGKGYIINASYEQLSGDHTFGILGVTHRMFRTLREDLLERRTILATKLHGSTVVGDAPTFEKFYGGGTGLYGIRGFEYRGVSTRGLQTNVANPQRKDPIGSDWIFLASSEVSVPLVGEEFAALFFVDTGAIDSGNYRAAVGAGVRIQIPRWFGPVPMEFALALPVMKDDEDDTEVFSFSVGRLF